jgi:phenylalanyl-tRNA synthetase alpha chain
MKDFIPLGNIPLSIKNKIGKNIYQIPDHPICIIKERIYDYFKNSREIFEGINPYVDTKSNFDDLLIPSDHPSRSQSDTFYKDVNTVLRTHTSAHQTQFMRDGKNNFLVTGDVYRKDEIDAFHYPVFHQMEGVSILDGQIDPIKVCEVIKQNLGGLIEFLFPGCEYKFVDTYFPFTNPSCEIEVLLNGKWVEVLGAGVIREEIMTNCGLINKSGWAFGLGLERLAMIFFEIPDIRYFWTDDERFINQFKKGQITKFKEYSKYPSAVRDISFYYYEPFMPNDFYTILNDCSENLVSKTDLIDSFLNPKTGQKSVSYRIHFESLERTLTSDEVNSQIIKIKDNLIEKYSVIMR